MLIYLLISFLSMLKIWMYWKIYYKLIENKLIILKNNYIYKKICLTMYYIRFLLEFMYILGNYKTSRITYWKYFIINLYYYYQLL